MEPVAISQHLWLLVCRPADRANQAVTALLRRVDENVEQLYPNLRTLIKEKPLYNDLAIARRLDLLRIWNNIMYLLRVRREMLEGWMYNAAGLGIGRSARAARLKLVAPAVLFVVWPSTAVWTRARAGDPLAASGTPCRRSWTASCDCHASRTCSSAGLSERSSTCLPYAIPSIQLQLERCSI